MNNSFWSDFLANLLSDLVVGVILGVPLAWWIGKKLNELAGSEQRKAEKRARVEKAIGYLELLKVEIDRLSNNLPCALKDFESSELGKEIWISTARWEVLQPSGELPRLLDPELVGSLADFYDALLWAKQGRHWIVTSWLVPTPGTVSEMLLKRKVFKEISLAGLRSAVKSVGDLPEELDSEIRHLKAELKKP